MLTRCNRCNLVALAKLGTVVIQPNVKPPYGYNLSITYPQTGKTVWAMWVMGLSTQCACGTEGL